ncbi:pyridoxamine 5'-phosphate oxidase-domain-containing protein [Tuber borchii]|uniref:Pyridoxamine 5'-phosphate oxidase-domain-containing protein n=1 Tax=Tuber borchii TaxID=42251 RepID=A0A2T7A2Y5_TUBBO|nr:pyridoxamine 5'-phosphate oxidase-domain-containing protein [Tuber borchii]
MSNPPWKPLFLTHIETLKPPTFTLATTTTVPPGYPSLNPFHDPQIQPSSHPPTPRCRTMIYRGLLTSLPPNPQNPLSDHNPPLYTSHLPTFTTDSRMTKTSELLSTSKPGGSMGTSAGEYVEAMFWIESTQNQWRMRGRTYLLAEDDVNDTPAITDVLERYLVPQNTGIPSEGEEKTEWTWKKEVQMHFGNMTPALRGSFANPPPGTPVSLGDNGSVVKAAARRNFRVGVVVPEVVERLDLKEDDAKARRWVYWIEDGKWKVQETWP